MNDTNTTTHQITIGTRVHCILYEGMDGIVYKINGAQRPETIREIGFGMTLGGNADFSVVFPTYVTMVPEAIIRGAQWTIWDDVATAEEIEAALLNCQAEGAKAKAESELEKTRFDEAVKRAEADFTWLERQADSKKSGHALAASNIRKELKRAFPAVKIHVTSKSYSGGDSVAVHWNLGPTTKQVEAITDKYRDAEFDGMTDCSNHRPTPHNQVFGNARFVHASRGYKRELDQGEDVFLELVWRALCEKYGKSYDGKYTILYENNRVDTASDHAWRILQETEVPAKWDRFELVTGEGKLNMRFI